MKNFSFQTRQSLWDQLDSKEWDMIILGGGITGAGIAREASYRGLRTCLIEKKDFAAETSSHSSKLIHGGLRYLEHFEFALVFESLHEKNLLMNQIAPHLVRPLPFIIPVWKGGKYGPFLTGLGLTLYDLLASFRNYKNHHKLSPRDLAEIEPILDQEKIETAFLYYDGQTDDSRLTFETILSAWQEGASPLNYVEGLEILWEQGKFSGLLVRDCLSGTEKQIRGKVLVNATGPFINTFLASQNLLDKPLLRPTKGVHIIVSQEDFPVSHGITFTSAVDGRIMFILPWRGYTLIGTTDTAGNPTEDKEATPEDIAYILESLKNISQKYSLTQDKIINAYAGWRPLVAEEKKESDISRTHKIWLDPRGIVSIGGGKLTTYRKMAKDCVQKILGNFPLVPTQKKDTAKIPLPGAIPQEFDIKRNQKEFPFPLGSRISLLEKYLEEKGGQERLVSSIALTKGEVKFYIYEEMAITPADILERRTSLALMHSDYGVSVLDSLVQIMGDEMGWKEEEKEKRKQEYLEMVKNKGRWKS